MTLRAHGALGLLTGLGTWLDAGSARAEEAAGGTVFDPHLGLVFWTWVVFLLLLVLLGKTAWKPLLRVLEQREKRIQEALDEARRQREETARLLEEHKRMLADAQRQAQEIVAQGRKAAERLREELLEEARREQEQILARAREEIAHERERALEALRREAVDLSLAAAARLLRREIDDKENRRLVEEFLNEVAASRSAGRSA